MCSGRINSSCSSSGTRRVNIVTNPVISREWGKDQELFATGGTYPWSFVTQISHSDQPSHGDDHNPFQVTTSTLPKETFGPVASLLAATFNQGHPDKNHKLWNIVSYERYILHKQVLLECCNIWIESSQWENWNHLFCRKVSFLTAPLCQFQGVGQGMKQTYLHLWYLAALRCTISSLCLLFWWYGSQTELAYSTVGLTSDLNAVSFILLLFMF